jgi:putative membrane-bound dehydrogenase-like protein
MKGEKCGRDHSGNVPRWLRVLEELVMRRAFPVIAFVAVSSSFLIVGWSSRTLRSDDPPAKSTLLPTDAKSEPKRIEVPLNGHVFSLPEGFTIELVAGPPLVNRPITVSFDEEGRLYASDSSGTNDKSAKQLEDKPHRIVRLEDTDGDGKFDKSIEFADKMMFPEGTLWYDGSLYVAAPPSIWKLTDTDGDGVADQREEWFKGNTLTGCANDLHGPYLGPDGYIYWCKGAFAEQTYERPVLPVGPAFQPDPDVRKTSNATDGSGKNAQPTEKWTTKASHIFRARPDAPRDPETGSIRTSAIECVMTGGMDNPVDVVFTPTGERIFTTTFLVHPGQGNRDGLLHAVYGGVYGKDWNVIDSPSHPRTGDVMPVLCHLGAAAPCGLERLQSAAWGREYQDNLFACCFNMRKVTRHVLTPKGATFDCATTDFVVSNNLDFHPTDVIEDGDGSLLIVDTGGWYKLCCPTSQLWKPDVLGAIYRVRRTELGGRKAERTADPFGKNIDWATRTPTQLIESLNDPRTYVRLRASNELTKLGGKAAAPLIAAVMVQMQTPEKKPRWPFSISDREQISRLLWAMIRIDDGRIRIFMAQWVRALPFPEFPTLAAYDASLWRNRDASEGLLQAFQNGGSPFVKRLSVEAIGRVGVSRETQMLLWNSHDFSGDRFLEHSIIYALIELGDADLLREAISTGHTPLGSLTRTVDSGEIKIPGAGSRLRLRPACLRMALIALDQMPNGGLKPEEVAKYLTSPEPLLRETAAWIISRHADWGEPLAGYLRERLAAGELADAEQTTLGKQLAQFAKAASVQDLLATTARDTKLPFSVRGLALSSMHQSNLKELPRTWTPALVTTLGDEDAVLVGNAVMAVRRMPHHKDDAAALRTPLMRIATGEHRVNLLQTPSRPINPYRLDALAALPGGLTADELKAHPELFDFLLSQLAPELPVAQRGTAAEVLSKAKLSKAQLEKLTEQFATAGPLEVDRLLGAFEQTTDEQVGQKLIAQLKTAPALTALRADAIKTRLAKYSPSVQEAAQPLYAALNVDLDQQRKQLEEMLASLPPGDIVRGQQVFHNEKSACKACHAIGYLGGKTGPDLTRIGGIRNERDLLESILFPSASFVRSFEPVLIVTTSGKTVNGLIRSETPDELVLATGPNQEARVARADIEEMKPSSISIMPAGLDKQLTKEQLADLIAFLKACK